MDQETRLLFIKYTAEGITALYALYATLTDFHEIRNGNRVLSWRGYLGIAFLVFASLLTILNEKQRDSINDAKDRETSQRQQEQLKNELAMSNSLEGQRKSLADQQRNLTTALGEVRKNVSATSAVLKESRRMSNPLEAIVNIDVNVALPIESNALRPYLERLKAGGLDISQGFQFAPGHPLFPDPHNGGGEVVLFGLATPVEAEVGIRTAIGSMNWFGRCNPDYFRANLASLKMNFECYITHVEIKSATGQPLSHLDLEGALLTVDIGPSVLFPPGSSVGGGYSGPYRSNAPLIVDVTLYEKDGKEIVVSDLERDSSWGNESFRIRIPKAHMLPGGYGLPLPASMYSGPASMYSGTH